jgi:DNA-binding TFAR19-related protein (PDSD5 family)
MDAGSMSEEDHELEMIKLEKMLEMRKKLLLSKAKLEKEAQKPNAYTSPRKILEPLLVGRALEVLNAAEAQFPDLTKQIEIQLALLVKDGQIKGSLDGETLYSIFRRLGIPVRLRTKIVYLKHGKIQSLAEKLKGG